MTPERSHIAQASPALAIEPAVLAADNTPPAVDCLDYGTADILLAVGAGGIAFTGTNKIEFVLSHSFDNVTYEAVSDVDVIVDSVAPTAITGGIVRSLTAAHAAATVQKIGYVGGRRYLKLLADFGGTHGTGTPIAAVVVRGSPSIHGAA